MTQHILSLSYGKDSLACLGAIEKLGWQLDRIVHAEIWATDTIPADLPPMIEFKKKADEIIKQRYGIEVEHIYAVRGGSGTPTKSVSTQDLKRESSSEVLKGSQWSSEDGVSTLNTETKLTYESIFYRKIKGHRGGAGFTASRCAKGIGVRQTSRERQSEDHRVCNPVEPVLHGRTQERTYGFPMSIGRENWCTQLKTRVF